jgi:serine/threonine-protein kinase
MFTQLLTLPPIPLNAAKERLKFPAGLEKVVMKALSKEPSNRYSDVMAFTKAFQDAVSNPGVPEKTEPQATEESGLFAKMRGILRRP